MKCPKCGNELRESKKTPGYFLCDSCKKKFSQETLERFQLSASAQKKSDVVKSHEDDKEPVVPKSEKEVETKLEQKKSRGKSDTTPVNPEKISPEEQTYSNIPPEEIRNEREKEMKANYEAMLNIKEDSDDDSGQLSVEDLPVFSGLRIVIGIVSILCAVFLGYQAYSSGIFTTFIHTPGLTGIAGMLLAVCFILGGLITLFTHRSNSAPAFLLPCIFYLGGAIGCFFVPGSVMIVQILLFVSALIGAFLLFALCCAKKVPIILRILIFILAVAAAFGAFYISRNVVTDFSATSGKNLRLSTDNFSVSFEKIATGTDYEGEKALMVYYTITNKGSDTLVPSVAVTFKAMQDDTTLDPTIVSDEALSENESKEVAKGDSVRVCTSFVLLDQSDVTLQLYETFGSSSKTAETTLSLN